MLKVAIIGCGKIADLHVQQILRISGTRIVGVCDREMLMARQLRDRFPIDDHYDNPETLLEAKKPDVVHITTPPDSHLLLALLCIEAGTHIYVEKPFTLTTDDAVHILEAARRANKKVTVGHNLQFTRPALAMRKLIGEGFLGGLPVHMESHYGYDLGDVQYVKALLGDESHWVRRLPGKLLHNLISHGIAKIVEFLPGDDPEVSATAFASTALRKAGVEDIYDELRVMLHDRDSSVTAYFTFSTQLRPLLHQFHAYGRKMGLVTDDDHLVLLRLRGEKYKSYLDQFIPPMAFARQYLACGVENVRQFIKGELHNDAGMKNLIAAFYASIAAESTPPIPYREIVLAARVMDRIFTACYSASTNAQNYPL